MKQIRKRLTYANVMSSIAVFLVIGGATAFAALGKNTVGTKQLKKNAVTVAKLKANAVNSAKIKKNAVTSEKIRNDAITGEKVKAGSLTGAALNLSTLGTVPSAQTANNLNGRTLFSFFMPPGLRDVVTIGPFSIKALCAINVGGEDEAELQLLTAVDGAAMDDNSGNEFSMFDIADNPAFLVGANGPTGEPDIESDEGELIAVAPDGTTIGTDNHAAGVNIAGHSGECFFAGTVEKIS